MGRFDALTQLDNKPIHHSPSPSSKAVPQPERGKDRKPENLKAGKPEIISSRKPENLKAGIQENQKNEKYSTQLHPLLIKQIKQYALEHDLKDYEVIQQAVKIYLEKK